LGYGWVFLKILGFGWVWFRFLFFKKPGFRLGFGFFQIKKKLEIFRQNCDERRKKSKKIIQFFKFIAKHWAAMAGKILVPPKTNQNLCWSTPTAQNRSTTECWSVRPTYGKLVLSRSTTDFRLVLGPAFGRQIMNIFNGRPWFDHAALCCKESLNKIFDKKN
jgi:hypothetical protein